MSGPSLRVAFMGTPDWSVPIVQALHAVYPVCVVYSQPPRPQNRGHRVKLSPVHAWAVEQGIDVETPISLRTPEAEATFHQYHFDWVVVAAYGLILPAYALSTRLGATNVHASLLPRWRGAAPLHRALLAGDDLTGVAIMQMDKGLDTGPVWSSQSYTLTPQITIEKLHDDMAYMGGELLVQTAPQIISGCGGATPQPTEGITYADKIKKEEGFLDFDQLKAFDVERRVRALAGWPGTFFTYHGVMYKLHACHVVENSLPVGEHRISKNEWLVGCADGRVISLDTLQKPGGKPLLVADFLRGFI